jgi:hypothetical protein
LKPCSEQKGVRIHSPTTLRRLRAVEILDRLETPEAQALLRELTKGAADAHVTTGTAAIRPADAGASIAELRRAKLTAKTCQDTMKDG